MALQDQQGKTAQGLAEEMGEKEVAALLAEAPAQVALVHLHPRAPHCAREADQLHPWPWQVAEHDSASEPPESA